MTPAEVLNAHGVTLESGLTSANVLKLRAEHGPNELDKEEGTVRRESRVAGCPFALPPCPSR